MLPHAEYNEGGGAENDQRDWCLNSLVAKYCTKANQSETHIFILFFYSLTRMSLIHYRYIIWVLKKNEKHFCQHHALVLNALQFFYDIYASTTKSPSAVQI